MISRQPATLLAALVSAAVMVCACGARARAEGTAPEGTRFIRVSHDAAERDRVLMNRAAMEQARGNLRGVVENLEGIDFSAGPSFAEADRAAFLLGQAYLRLGGVDRFSSLARHVARWDHQTSFTRWLAYELLLVRIAGGESAAPRAGVRAAAPDTSAADSSLLETERSPATAPLAAGLLLRAGDPAGALRQLENGPGSSVSPLALYIRAIALERTGANDEAELTTLATADSTTILGRDLEGAARVRLATRAMARGKSGREWLEGVPPESRYASRAHHMLGLAAIERGDAASAIRELESVLAGDSAYTGRREVSLALASQALESGDWTSAERTYEEVDRDWKRQHDALTLLLAEGSLETVWWSWRSNLQDNEALALDALPAETLAQQMSSASADLQSRPDVAVPVLDAPRPGAALPWMVSPPPADAWAAVTASERRLGEAMYDLERARWAADRERAALEERRRYLEDGLGRARSVFSQLSAESAMLDSLRRVVDAVDARLKAVSEEERRRVEVRTASIIASCERSLRWIHAMRRLFIVPDSTLAAPVPTGFPGPGDVLAAEDSVALAVQSAVRGIAQRTPDLLDRSYHQAWRPSIIGRIAAFHAVSALTLDWARHLVATLDSSLVAASSSETLRRLEARVTTLENNETVLRSANAALRDRVAREAVKHTLAAMDEEREAIDYGLAGSAYGLSVKLSGRDSTESGALISAGTPADTLASGADEAQDAEAAAWRARAIPLLNAFLQLHPHSPARGEMRFRLADLEFLDAHQAFREQMSRFLQAQAEGKAAGHAVPVLGHAASLELYRKILAEDRDFPHMDAVLFDAGMILADDGESEAAKFFGALVTEHPESPYCQQAYLRMGDMQFNAKEFQRSVALYAHAASGGDPSLRAIAFYKMGWAHFNEDRFIEAADAFRSVLDLYASQGRAALQVDIEGEADAYLVYSLAGAGGAAAFSSYFDRIGSRAYEKPVLMALGQHFRHYGEYPKAAAVDQLFIQRYPLEGDALMIAERLIETYHRSNRPGPEEEARLSLAPRFAPEGDWSRAQVSDSVRAAGTEFSHASWRLAAFERHKKARETGARDDWSATLKLYEAVLSRWPNDADAPELELAAGEAASRLDDREAALRHFRTAASSDRDSVAAPAMWQIVAVTDAWYESTRATGPRGRAATGSDSVARAVIAAGDALLERFPAHPKGADLIWRESQLALAQGWTDRASQDLNRLITRFPDDSRSPLAACQRGDVLFASGDFEAAGSAFEAAAAVAHRAGRDSLERRASRAIPVCAYRQAEAAVAADSTQFDRHAELFEKVADRWPTYEHADLAAYRAALAYLKAGKERDAIRDLKSLIERHPASEYVRDAHLQLAKTWESVGEREQAAIVYLEFAKRFPRDESARGAWLKAPELLAAAGLTARAEEVKLAYIHQFPDDIEAAMEFYEALARRDLATISPELPVSALLGVGKGSKGVAAPPSHLAEYLRQARLHPKLASRDLVAQVRFLQGEEADAAFMSKKLGQPIAKFIKVKQRSLDSLVARYRRCADVGVPEWSHASAFRIGEALVAFAEALEHCPPPADLQGDDLRAYEEVLGEQSRALGERGEDVWSDMLRQKREAGEDPWIARAQSALWPRLSGRFLYRPEFEFPLIDAHGPGHDHEGGAHGDRGRVSSKAGAGETRPVADREHTRP